MRVLGAAAAVVLLAGVAGSAQQAPPSSGSAVVAGQVIDDGTGRPIGGVTVTLSRVGSAPPRAGAAAPVTRQAGAITNADGRFVFRMVPAGRFTLATQLNGYAAGGSGQPRIAAPVMPFDVADGERRTDHQIRMWRLASVSGIVRDDLGEPLVGVSVWALRRTAVGDRTGLTFTGGTVEATDERGYYRLSFLAPGTYAIAVRSSIQSNPASTVTSVLQARAQAAPGGPPMAGIRRESRESGAINIERAGLEVDGWQASVSIGSPQPLAGPDDTVLLHPTTFYPGVTDAGAATLVTLSTGDDRGALDFIVPLVRGTRVSGTLHGPEGPAAHHGLRLVPETVDAKAPMISTPVAYATTDASGRFVLLGVAPGAYRLMAYRTPLTGATAEMFERMSGERVPPPTGPAPPSLSAEMPLSVGDAPMDGIALTLAPSAIVAGRVEFSGNGPSPAAAEMARTALTLSALAGDTTAAQTRVTETGTFAFSGVAPGRYLLSATAPPGWSLTSARVGGVELVGRAITIAREDLSDAVLTFTDRAMTVSGSVRADAATGTTGASVVAMPADLDAWISGGMAPSLVRIVSVDAAGAFTLTLAVPGDYLVVAVPPEIEPRNMLWTVNVDPDIARRLVPLATKVAVALGDTRSVTLTLRSVR